MATAPNVTEKRGNIFLHRRRKMCECMKNTEMSFYGKNNTDPIPHSS